MEGEFHIWFQDGVRIAEEIGAGITVPRLVGRQAHRLNATIQVIPLLDLRNTIE